jgi:hypothetical protein
MFDSEIVQATGISRSEADCGPFVSPRKKRDSGQ